MSQSTSIPSLSFPISKFSIFAAFLPSISFISTSASRNFSNSFRCRVYRSFFSNLRAFFLDKDAFCRIAWLVRGIAFLLTLALLSAVHRCLMCLRLLLRVLAVLRLNLVGVFGLEQDGMVMVKLGCLCGRFLGDVSKDELALKPQMASNALPPLR